MLIDAARRALYDLIDPKMRGILWKVLGLSLICLIALWVTIRSLFMWLAVPWLQGLFPTHAGMDRLDHLCAADVCGAGSRARPCPADGAGIRSGCRPSFSMMPPSIWSKITIPKTRRAGRFPFSPR